MIHYWECDRCTHQWQSCCFSEYLEKKEDKARNSRQLASGLCWDCFEQLETGEIKGLEMFNFAFYLRQKAENRTDEHERFLGRFFNEKVGLYDEIRYSGMCHKYIGPTFKPDGSYLDRGNFETGWSAEQNQLFEISGEILSVYSDLIKEQRTQKRIELDEYQKTAGFCFFGPNPRPEGFIGDPAGKVRFQALFGFDPKSGAILPPTINSNDGTKGEINE